MNARFSSGFVNFAGAWLEERGGQGCAISDLGESLLKTNVTTRRGVRNVDDSFLLPPFRRLLND